MHIHTHTNTLDELSGRLGKLLMYEGSKYFN